MELRFFVTLKSSQGGFAVGKEMCNIQIVAIGNYFFSIKNRIKKKETFKKKRFSSMWTLNCPFSWLMGDSDLNLNILMQLETTAALSS